MSWNWCQPLGKHDFWAKICSRAKIAGGGGGFPGPPKPSLIQSQQRCDDLPSLALPPSDVLTHAWDPSKTPRDDSETPHGRLQDSSKTLPRRVIFDLKFNANASMVSISLFASPATNLHYIKQSLQVQICAKTIVFTAFHAFLQVPT